MLKGVCIIKQTYFTMTTEYDCVICSEEIKKCDKHEMPCGHKFHHFCITQWIKQNTIDMNKCGNKYFKTSFLHTKHTKMCGVLGLYNSGEFACPMCKKLYTTMTEDDYQHNLENIDNTTNLILYKPYYIKLKYSVDGFDLNEVWMSQYFCDTMQLMCHTIPEIATSHYKIINKLTSNIVPKIGIQMKTIMDKNKLTGKETTFHVLGCNCDKDVCLGYSFVPEELCPVCPNSIDLGMSLPCHIEHCSINHVKKCQERFNKFIKKYINENSKYDNNINDDEKSVSEGSSESEESMTSILNKQLLEQMHDHTLQTTLNALEQSILS